MSRDMWKSVKEFRDGESLDAATLNVPIGQLGDRTAYLYARLKELLASGKMSSVVLTGVDLGTSPATPEAGNAVYLDKDTGKFVLAKATMSLYDDFTAADSAFTVGLLLSRDGTTGNVLVYGRMDLNPDGSPIAKSDMVESGEEFRPGRYYLSANEAGRLTAHPNGPLIYVCAISGSEDTAGNLSGTAVVSPQFLDIGTSHVHRTAVLTARYAGTRSTAGYLPDIYSSEHPEYSPTLRFGGTWTSDKSVVYEFSLPYNDATWKGGVVLRWKENGEASDRFEAMIHAPDEEVPISHGLTARLSLPKSNSIYAYRGLELDERSWGAMEFPEAGRGWLDHEPVAIAGSDALPGLKVAVRGRFDASPLVVNVAFPAKTQILSLGKIASGDTFSYDGKVFEFTGDTASYSGDNIPVALGTCKADTALYLVEALGKSGAKGTFASFESDGGTSASLLVMDGEDVPENDIVAGGSDSTGSRFDVIGDDGSIVDSLVVYDSNGRVLGGSPVVEAVTPFSWKEDGDLSVMVYQSSSPAETVTVATGTVVSGVAIDDEPDAVYDYVIGMDQQVAKYWPPVPPKSAALMVNGVEMDNKALLPASPTVSFGRNTIHWFEDDLGRRPWPEELLYRKDPIDPAFDKTEVMHWVRGFQGATGPVTSIQVKDGSPIRIYGYGTEDYANTGDLWIAADFDFAMENGGAPGYNVPKRARNGKLLAGPVVERITGGAGVSVISKAGCPRGQGEVVIALDNGAYRSQFTDIALENAEQAKIGMFPYIRLKGYTGAISSPSAFTATMRVPTNLPDGSYNLMVYATIFGESSFGGVSRRSAAIKFSYNILPDFMADEGLMYSSLKTSLLKPNVERDCLVPFGHAVSGGIEYNGFDPVLVSTDDPDLYDRDDVVAKTLGRNIPDESEFIPMKVDLRPGYLVGIRIARAVTSVSGVEPYTFPIGVINLSWALVSAEDMSHKAVGSSILEGVVIKANTPGGIRGAVETMGKALGATVIAK